MLTFDAMTDAQKIRLAEIATSHGMSPAELLAIAQGQPKFERDARVAGVKRRTEARTTGRFHIGESMGAIRRP